MNSRFNLMRCGRRCVLKSRRHRYQIGHQTFHEIYYSVCVSRTSLLTPCAPSTKSTSENDILSFKASDCLRTAWSCPSENRRVRLTDAPEAAWASCPSILNSAGRKSIRFVCSGSHQQANTLTPWDRFYAPRKNCRPAGKRRNPSHLVDAAFYRH